MDSEKRLQELQSLFTEITSDPDNKNAIEKITLEDGFPPQPPAMSKRAMKKIRILRTRINAIRFLEKTKSTGEVKYKIDNTQYQKGSSKLNNSRYQRFLHKDKDNFS